MTAYGPALVTREYPKLEQLPLTSTLSDGTAVELVLIKAPGEPFDEKNAGLIAARDTLHVVLNDEIKGGISYPQATIMSLEEFTGYFFSHHAFALRKCDDISVVYGGFYIKPNFPGRCAHICNGGFLVASSARRKGAAKFMGTVFPRLAKYLGYRASMFNLVFENNTASLNLWKSLPGYIQSGRIPKAGQLADGTYVDAIQFYNDFYAEADGQGNCTDSGIATKTTSSLPPQ